MSSTNTKKPLPYSTTKNWLYDKYRAQMPEACIRKEINTIIVTFRRLNVDNPRVQMVRHAELMEFVSIHGLPPGYIAEAEKV